MGRDGDSWGGGGGVCTIGKRGEWGEMGTEDEKDVKVLTEWIGFEETENGEKDGDKCEGGKNGKGGVIRDESWGMNGEGWHS